MKLFDTRIEMIDELMLEGQVGCELGVFAGEFAEILVRKHPKKLTLIDAWHGEMCCSGNEDGNYMVNLPSQTLYNTAVSRFANKSNVIVRRGWTQDEIPRLEDGSLDYVYIDADHSYEGVKRDLRLILPKMKQNALIMGHDYEMNMTKAKTVYNFGVKQAVDEFCQEQGWELFAKAMDGCVSFALRKSNI